jgi:hemoglobin
MAMTGLTQLRVEGETWTPTQEDTPYQRLGGSDGVKALVEAFYDTMERDEPALLATHKLDEAGRVPRALRDKVALYLIGWLGGPQDYVATHGHPRLRMRHAHVPVDTGQRDAWTRCMGKALDHLGVQGPVRTFLDQKFVDLADHLRNKPG